MPALVGKGRPGFFKTIPGKSPCVTTKPGPALTAENRGIGFAGMHFKNKVILKRLHQIPAHQIVQFLPVTVTGKQFMITHRVQIADYDSQFAGTVLKLITNPGTLTKDVGIHAQ